MAQSYVTEAGTLIIPSAVSDIKVATANAGLATTGVLMLVGEADAGPRFDLESSLQDNSFGPDQLAGVVAKYGSGPLVDAFSAATAPANDPNIVGAPSRMILVKTNSSGQAKATLQKVGGGSYADLTDRSYGKAGNLIFFTIDSKVAESLPTTGAVTWIPNVAALNIELRVNGGAALPLAVGVNTKPDALKTSLDGLAGVLATGGATKATTQVSVGNLALTIVGGNTVQINYTGTFTVTPAVGDTLYIPTGSVIDGGAGDQNVGGYVVTAATSNSITATKLSDAGKAGAVAGTITAPVAVTSIAASATPANDLVVYGALTVTLEAGTVIDGVGKSLELAELTTGTDLLSRYVYQLGTVTPVTFVSKAGAPKTISSTAEYRVKLNVNRQKDNIQEELEAGGEVALKVGYVGTTATLTITDSVLATVVAGGAGTALTLDLKDFPTIQDVATFINSKPGYKAEVGTAILGQLPSTALDDVAAVGIASAVGAPNGRVKIDAYRFANKVSGESVLTKLASQVGVGLPAAVAAVAYLDGGTKGGTTDSDVTDAMAALERVRGNFLVPLFSRDAALDKLDRLTDNASTYTIAAINAAARAHVLKMSTLKRRKNRQAFPSIKDTFAKAREAGSNTASFRCAMPYMDIRNQSADGTVKQFAPWMGSVIAAAMQAAGFYKAIVRKFANVSGALQAAKDFDDQDDTQVEDALLSGLLPMRRAETGGWYWVSDQTTYGKDSNFVFNSIQATYVADIIALTTAQRMEAAFVGQSVADVNEALARAFLETIMEDFKRLKLIAPSDDAPAGFRNAKIKINGTAMVVSLEVKLAGAIYFIPISFLVSQVQQSA